MVTSSDAACNRMLRSKWRVKEMKAGKKKKNGFWFCRPKGRPQPRAGCVTHTSYCLNDKYTLPLNDKCTLLLNDKCTLLFNDKYILLLNDKCTLLLNDKCTLLINDKYILLLNDKCTLLLNDKYTLLLNDKWPLLFKIKLNSTPTAPPKKEEEERFFHDCWLRNILSLLTVQLAFLTARRQSQHLTHSFLCGRLTLLTAL